ncbi:alpha/beta fold hydrolase [Mucilaginibacter sp. SP1R1]|uniref:alpha/beta fold hydrolase n=1 Tax=Mucilaginibacter sp. SP1R1 TaxID=2723091 RepID=UPI002105F7A0|nr:alpha/beta hydrolase [Mucilaginibacter sp. SP1R1]
MTTGNTQAQTTEQGRYAQVNGIKMYYEIHGTGAPLVLLHGGGSTIYTSFGRILPTLAQSHQVIAIELQAHGHTGDRDAPETFEQDANDVAELLRQLDIPKADLFGFSNGGQTALELGIKHPKVVNKLIIASAFYKRDAIPAGFWEGFKDSKFSDMPQVYKDEYLKINDQAGLINMFNKDVQRMLRFKDWTKEEIESIQAPALVVIGDRDLPPPEHAVEMAHTLPHGRLAILPGAHGEYFGEAFFPDKGSKMPELFVAMINEFLAAPVSHTNLSN